MNAEIAHLIATVKRQLKAQGKSYRDVAHFLDLSEASVKRLFSSERFTVERLAKIGELLGFTLAELMQTAASSVPELDTLTSAQEAELVSDEKLLMVTVLALNHWSVIDMLNWYHISAAEVVKRLRILDRMGVIELLPGDRIRRRARRDFDWLPNGPIKAYFARQVVSDFLKGPFDDAEESLDFSHAMLTKTAQAELKVELRRFRRKLASLHEESVPASLRDKRGLGLLLAMRRWEPAAFMRLRRNAPETQ
jgi:transcriptional regulator with XRE-family HTH domain